MPETIDAAAPARRLPVPDCDLEERSVRARAEPMAVRSLGPELYEVDSQSGGTYVVSLTADRCSCPDHAIRGERCKHLRRVAIEVARGTLPPPGWVAVSCAVCGEPVHVRYGTEGPQYCETHAPSVGDQAVDRETGKRVLVVGVSDRRADEVTVAGTDRTVAEYPGNEAYDPGDSVVAAVYPGVGFEEDGPRPGELRVYSFPRGRLVTIEEEDAADDAEALAR